MLVLAHMGVGSRLVKPWAQSLPRWALLLGTLVPDLIDKPLFYAMLYLSRLSGGDLGLINNSRTLGHTALLLVAVTLVAVAMRSKAWAALALGIATHAMLDNLGDGLADWLTPDAAHPGTHSAMVALLWPFYQARFPLSPFSTMGGHLARAINPLTLGFEVVGGAILFWDWWQGRHETEIRQFFSLKRAKRREAQHRHKNATLAQTAPGMTLVKGPSGSTSGETRIEIG